ncbi:MAG: hypothetical protein LIQ31_16575 [Planctomycetes bacterium]|nr:hypothetical protein [Planctomycetota bacterium]
MADRPGSFRQSQRVSRHTMVMKKAKDDDARRLAEREEGGEASGRATAVSARLTARGAVTRRLERQESGRTISGRRVVVEHEGTVSGRQRTSLTGRQATSVKVAGGDTIIRYKSGDMIIRRGAKRQSIRRQAIWTYALGYILLFGCYMYVLLAGTTTVTPEAFLDRAFSLRHSDGIVDLERAALVAMRGNRTPAELRLAQRLSFYDENNDTVVVEKGARLTLLNAAKLAHAIIQDQSRPPDRRAFQEPFRVYEESYLANINWPYWMTFYNALGFFLLLGLFLWRPLMHYLGTQGKKTAVALRNSRDAQAEALEYRNKYRSLAGEINEQKDRVKKDIARMTESEMEAALDDARRQADQISGSVATALDNAAERFSDDIRGDAAQRACDQARRILEKRLGPAEHDAAIDELIADLAGMNLQGNER